MQDSELSMMQKLNHTGKLMITVHRACCKVQHASWSLNLRLHVVLDVGRVRFLVKGGLLKLVIENNIHTADSGTLTALILNFCWRIATNQWIVYVSLWPTDHLQTQESKTDITSHIYWLAIVQPMFIYAELIRKMWQLTQICYSPSKIVLSIHCGFIGHNLQRCPKLSSLYVHKRAATQFKKAVWLKRTCIPFPPLQSSFHSQTLWFCRCRRTSHPLWKKTKKS